MKYEEYLKTQHWKDIREERKKIDHYTCQLCGSNDEMNLVVHHLVYNQFHENVETDLVTLCNKCHSLLHVCLDGAVTELDNIYDAYSEKVGQYVVSQKKLDALNFRYQDQLEKIIAYNSEELISRCSTPLQRAKASKMISDGLKTFGKKDYSNVSSNVKVSLRSTKKLMTMFLFSYVQQAVKRLKNRR